MTTIAMKMMAMAYAIPRWFRRQVTVQCLVIWAVMALSFQLCAMEQPPAYRVGLIAMPVLFTRSYGQFSIERGGAGVFATTSDGDLSGTVEASLYGSNSPIETLRTNFKLAVFVDIGLINIDSSTTVGPEVGLQYTLPLGSSENSQARTIRIVLGIISHIPLGPGIMDVGLRTTPSGTFSGVDGDGTSSKYGLVLRYGFRL